MLGQLTPFGTTIVHELAFRTERLLNYVATHEAAHKGQWYGHCILPVAIFCVPAAFGSFTFALLALLGSVILLNPQYLLAFVAGLVWTAMLIGVPCLYSWLLELNADCQAIRILGMPAIMEALADARDLSKPSPYLRIVGRMTHPPITLTFRACRLFHRNLRNTGSRPGEAK